jgi:hypothetical protein
MEFTLIHYNSTYEWPFELLKYARLFYKEEGELNIHNLADILQTKYVMNDPLLNRFKAIAKDIAIVKYNPIGYVGVSSATCGPIFT